MHLTIIETTKLLSAWKYQYIKAYANEIRQRIYPHNLYHVDLASIIVTQKIHTALAMQIKSNPCRLLSYSIESADILLLQWTWLYNIKYPVLLGHKRRVLNLAEPYTQTPANDNKERCNFFV